MANENEQEKEVEIKQFTSEEKKEIIDSLKNDVRKEVFSC